MSKSEVERRNAEVLTMSTMTNDPRLKAMLEEENGDLNNFEIFNKGMISYSGKENIDGFVTVLNLFLRIMILKNNYPTVINVNDSS